MILIIFLCYLVFFFYVIRDYIDKCEYLVNFMLVFIYIKYVMYLCIIVVICYFFII